MALHDHRTEYALWVLFCLVSNYLNEPGKEMGGGHGRRGKVLLATSLTHLFDPIRRLFAIDSMSLRLIIVLIIVLHP